MDLGQHCPRKLLVCERHFNAPKTSAKALLHATTVQRASSCASTAGCSSPRVRYTQVALALTSTKDLPQSDDLGTQAMRSIAGGALTFRRSRRSGSAGSGRIVD